MNPLRIIGVALLLAGLTTIGLTLWYSYRIFTAETQAPQLFSATERQSGPRSSSGGVEEQIGSVIESQLNSLLPSDAVPETLNLAAWSLFAGVAVFAGSQVSSIGVKLLRP